MSGDPVLLISDLHTRYEVLNAQIRHAREVGGHPVEQALVLGDFGFFADALHDWFRRRGNRFLTAVACIDGNHEDHGALPDLARRYADVVTYLPRGSVTRLGPWRALCLGGARYMDAWSTPRGCEITPADIDACLAHAADAVDLVLSHDCPTGIGVPNTPGLEHYGTPGVPQLADLAGHFRPRWWFFGHHHRWFDLPRDATRYVGLPQSWCGYALLFADGRLEQVRHEVPIGGTSRWRRWFGLG